VCYLRYDDTNPEAETTEFFAKILENVEWLGHKPYKITYSSDYFDALYNFAIILIKKGLAYVCHLTATQVAENRLKKIDSPWRNTPVEQNLEDFEKMRKGFYDEHEVTLRLKMDMQSDKTVLRDVIAYRVKYYAHVRTGNKWCIYPSYDYSHGICDSLENITHSFCTLEFVIRRDAYFWPLEQLDLYKAVEWEFSRLNITNTVMSKRKLKYMVNEGVVKGWDDPRMSTMFAMKRRGYTPEAINRFSGMVGITKNDNFISIKKLEHYVREDLDSHCKRVFVILNPLRVVITNIPEKEVKYVTVLNHPKDNAMGNRNIPYTRIMYIDRSDFKEKDEEDFYGLALNKEVGLRYLFNVTCTEVIKERGEVKELRVIADFEKKNKPKGHIHWVSQPEPGKEPQAAEVRLYDVLFKSDDPGSLENWIEDINPDSLIVVPNALIEPSLNSVKVEERFQFERVGYFCVDPDTTASKTIFNRTVTLKESYPKFAKSK